MKKRKANADINRVKNKSTNFNVNVITKFL